MLEAPAPVPALAAFATGVLVARSCGGWGEPAQRPPPAAAAAPAGSPPNSKGGFFEPRVGGVQVEGSMPTGGLLPTSMRHLDRFLGWGCAPTLLELGVFPDAQEVSESMAMLWALESRVMPPSAAKAAAGDKGATTSAGGRLAGLSFRTEGAVAVVVGDGATPRTACLLAMRSRFRRICSVDPALPGGPCVAGRPGDTQQPVAGGAGDGWVPHPSVERVWLAAARVADVTIDIESNDSHVVVLLPHCHVVPDDALRSVRLCARLAGSPRPTITVVQMPCCQYVWHDRCAGELADETYADAGVAAAARTIRIWRDVGARAVASGLVSAPGEEGAGGSGRAAGAAARRTSHETFVHVREAKSAVAEEKAARVALKLERRRAKLAARRRPPAATT